MTFLFVLFTLASPADHRINAVIGDASWIATYGAAPVDGTDEVTRIRTHLTYAIDVLRERRVATHQIERDAALAALADYARRGVFPRRTGDGYAGRRPRFIDDRGVRCAVGEVIAASGQPELAASIARDYEYAYVPDIATPGLATWATTHGFTFTELAMIQPQYSPPPDEHSTRAEIELAKDALTLECAKLGAPTTKLAIHVFGLESGAIRVASTNTSAFARCFVAHASGGYRGGAWRHHPKAYDFDMTLALATPQQLLDRQLANERELSDCTPRPGALSRRAAFDITSDEHGLAIHADTTPSNPEVDRCVEHALRQQLAAFDAGAWKLHAHGSATLLSPFEPVRLQRELEGAAATHATDCYVADAPSRITVTIKAHIDDPKLAITVDAKNASFATCVADKIQATLQTNLGVSHKLETGAYERYFRIDRDVDARVAIPVETPGARDKRQQQQRKEMEERRDHELQ